MFDTFVKGVVMTATFLMSIPIMLLSYTVASIDNLIAVIKSKQRSERSFGNTIKYLNKR